MATERNFSPHIHRNWEAYFSTSLYFAETCSLTILPGPARVLLNKIYQPFFTSLYLHQTKIYQEMIRGPFLLKIPYVTVIHCFSV